MTFTATLPHSFQVIAGQDIDLFPVSSDLTVAQAADRLQFSENHLSDLLNAGLIASRLENGKRLVPLSCLLEYEQMRKGRRAWLKEQVCENQEMGFYD